MDKLFSWHIPCKYISLVNSLDVADILNKAVQSPYRINFIIILIGIGECDVIGKISTCCSGIKYKSNVPCSNASYVPLSGSTLKGYFEQLVITIGLPDFFNIFTNHSHWTKPLKGLKSFQDYFQIRLSYYLHIIQYDAQSFCLSISDCTKVYITDFFAQVIGCSYKRSGNYCLDVYRNRQTQVDLQNLQSY